MPVLFNTFKYDSFPGLSWLHLYLQYLISFLLLFELYFVNEKAYINSYKQLEETSVIIKWLNSNWYFYKKDVSLSLYELVPILYDNCGIEFFLVGGFLLITLCGSVFFCARKTLETKF